MGLRLWLMVFAVGMLLRPISARAQFGQGAIFEPEIGIVNSGVVLDAQATVSADRKYVTLNMRTDRADLLALRTFQFQEGGNGQVNLPGGVVGGVNPVIAGSIVPQRINAPMRVQAGHGGVILLKRGVTPLVAGD
jgi:hypothetical protein